MKYVLILIGLLSLLSCEQKTDIEGQRVFWHNLERQYAETTAFIEQQSDYLIRQTEDILYEPGKEKYKSVVAVMHQATNQYDILIHLVDSLERTTDERITVRKFEDHIEEQLESIVQIYHDFMILSGEEVLGLRSHEVEAILESFEQYQWQTFANWRYNNLSLLNTSYRHYAYLDLLQKIQKEHYRTLRRVTSYVSGRAGCDFNFYFPVVNARHGAVKTNQSFEAELSIGSYSSQIDPKNITMVVNGDTLGVDDEGKAMLVIPPTYRTGQQVLKLEAFVTNPLTGEVSTGQSIFEYQVIP